MGEQHLLVGHEVGQLVFGQQLRVLRQAKPTGAICNFVMRANQ